MDFTDEREVERVEVNGLVVVSVPGSSVTGKAAIQNRLQRIADEVFGPVTQGPKSPPGPVGPR